MPKSPTHQQILAMPLRQQARALEEQRHKSRMAMLTRMDAQLALLEAEQSALKAAGLDIHGSEIETDAFGKILRLPAVAFGSAEARHLNALLTVGFKIEKQDSCGSRAHLLLKKGRLRLGMSVDTEVLIKVDQARARAAAAPAEEVGTAA
ncbi:hypothetical protein [Cupriavidus malaysiensis]|uniref:Uncharacterized protein n=1 Tax=Cupriavidus malaysiensis TaxID=367825 RepID=A0ABM6F5P5_9BURK|nr:hypothetical protein [Cupriavidus malaysiensis]AOZ06793.1 hypothetical protein BKK80_13920 [Cupriavidus malaysiensis]